MYFYYFVFLVITCIVITYVFSSNNDKNDEKKEKDKYPEQSNEVYKKLNKSYLIVYSLVVTGDWLQGPYNYTLYQSYGLSLKEIGMMSVCGFLSSLLLGTYVGSIADKFGRKKMCISFCILYATSCILRYVPNILVLLFGRVLSGISTSLLFSCFEAWLVNEHNARGLQSSLLSNTLSWAAFLNGLTAIISGLIGNIVVSYFGYASPYGTAVVFLLLSAIYIKFNWNENYGNTNEGKSEDKKESSIISGIKVVFNDFTILSVGLIQSFFEAAMYIFVFLYSPILEEAHKLAGNTSELPFGIIFAGFMVCIMIGSRVFNILNQKNWSIFSITLPTFLLAVISMLIPIITKNENILFWSFCLFETCCGLFFPTLGCLRSQLIPEEVRSSVMNLFRVPLNAIVVVVLLKVSSLSQTVNFLICALLCSMSLGLGYYLNIKENKIKEKEKE